MKISQIGTGDEEKQDSSKFGNGNSAEYSDKFGNVGVDENVKVEDERKSVAKYDYTKSFADQIEDYKNGKFPNYDTFLVCRTPDVYLDIGLSPLPMTINRTHIDYAINGTKDADHFLGDNIKQLPSALEKPIAIISSKTSPQNNIIAFVAMTHNNKQVIAPVFISGGGRVNGLVIDSNAIASTYAKTNAVKNLLIDALNEEKMEKSACFIGIKRKPSNLWRVKGSQCPKVCHLLTASYIVYTKKILLST